MHLVVKLSIHFSLMIFFVRASQSLLHFTNALNISRLNYSGWIMLKTSSPVSVPEASLIMSSETVNGTADSFCT